MQARRLGSYELIRRLGEGGMARVYLARDVRLGREVALKILEPQLAERSGFRERFLREARVAASLDHPHIVPLYDFGEADSLLYLVMPYVSGGSLQDVLKRAPLAMGEVVAYGSQIADALDYAHQRQVIHRDVKPANMLLHADGRLMLSDFGLAKILDKSRPNVSRGHPDAGTPEYMAPEQIEGRTDERSDVYALGVVLYLLLTGHLPFSGSTSSAVMDGHLYQLPSEPRQFNPAVTPAIQAVVLRALAKHPDDRYQRSGDLSAALLAALVAGDAEPLPFSLENDEGGSSGSIPTLQVSMLPHLATRPRTPPAPLPWELPDWKEETPSHSVTNSRIPSRPNAGTYNTHDPQSDLPSLGVGAISPSVTASTTTRASSVSALVSAATHGRMPLAANLAASSPPAMSDYLSAFQTSAPLRAVSHVAGPYPATTISRSTPPATPLPALKKARPRVWLWMIIALMVALVVLALLLHWLQGYHSADTNSVAAQLLELCWNRGGLPSFSPLT